MPTSIVTNSRLGFADLLLGEGVEFWDLLDLPEVIIQSDDLQYTVTGADRIDNIAYQHYGNPTLWWVIAVANDMEMVPNALYTGQVLRIPAPRYVLQQLFKQPKVR
jgi:nucleoid-associated protein YgaU